MYFFKDKNNNTKNDNRAFLLFQKLQEKKLKKAAKK